MSETIHHECGIVLMRLRKPLAFYIAKYDPLYAARKMYILMQKQRNRGQDGAGVATIKVGQKPGYKFLNRYRSMDQNAVEAIFKRIEKKYEKADHASPDQLTDAEWLKQNVAFMGELWLGHLRYGTHGKNNIENVHPCFRQNNWRSRNLIMAGNFNLTNVDELFQVLVELGQHPKGKADTVIIMEKIGHFLDEEVQQKYTQIKQNEDQDQISEQIEQAIDLQEVLRKACKDFDGGYVMAGVTGSGSAFVVRDPSGIRPAYFYADEEIIVMASEKPTIKTAFQVDYNQIREIRPGHALLISKAGDYKEALIRTPQKKTSCSFERIYFSRGNDPEIYQERKQLGLLLVPQILWAIRFDLRNTVFSYIPNTAEIAFLGMMEGIENYLIKKQQEVFIEGKPSLDSPHSLLSFRPRIEKIVTKDAKLRTFITEDKFRTDMVKHVYDITYEVVRKQRDTLVVLDDSIVRGSTLEHSILQMINKLEPKKVIIVSSAPQIRFPDCYGIDMSRMGDFIAFRAVVSLIKEHHKTHLLEEVYDACVRSQDEINPPNCVQRLYALFTDEEIADKIAEIARPKDFRPELKVIFQTVDDLHKAIPRHRGDWYFTGNYPTTGGNKIVNRSFIHYMEGKAMRAYH